MAIISNKDCVAGKPTIKGTRIWVSHVVEGIENLGIEGYLNQFPHLNHSQIEEALDYCRNQRCIGNVVKYCIGCTKDTSSPLKDNPEKGVHIVGDVPLDQVLEEWDINGKVLIIGTEESVNRKRDLWNIARQLYEEHFYEKN